MYAGVTFANSHIKSSRYFKDFSNCRVSLIIFIFFTILSCQDDFLLLIYNTQKKSTRFILIDFYISSIPIKVRTDSSLVQMAGIEPARFIQPQDFKSCASASSATSAFFNWLIM